MSHSHRHSAAPVSAADRAHHRRALRVMILIVVPIAIWTLAALILTWPQDVASHVRSDTSTYAVPGLTLQTGTVTEVTPRPCDGEVGSIPGVESTCASGQVRVDDGPETGQTVQVEFTEAHYRSGVDVGTKVKLFRAPTEGGPAYQFADFERSVPLITFLVIFAVLVVVVARLRGFMALLGLAFAAVIISQYMFPALVTGQDPTLVGLIGGSAIMYVVLYTAHGFTARTTTALIGTLFGLLISAGLGVVATRWAHLTGVSAEDDYLLAASAPDLALTSVVICGIIVAGLGVLNDVTITQASAVWELARDGKRGVADLFNSAMRIGRDHIASTVYTIAFATAGASLGTLLLIAVYQRPTWEVVQTEMFAAEILRTLVGSIGLVLAMPLTTIVGVYAVRVGWAARAGHSEKRDTHEDGRRMTDDEDVPSPALAGSAASPDADRDHDDDGDRDHDHPDQDHRDADELWRRPGADDRGLVDRDDDPERR